MQFAWWRGHPWAIPKWKRNSSELLRLPATFPVRNRSSSRRASPLVISLTPLIQPSLYNTARALCPDGGRSNWAQRSSIGRFPLCKCFKPTPYSNIAGARKLMCVLSYVCPRAPAMWCYWSCGILHAFVRPSCKSIYRVYITNQAKKLLCAMWLYTATSPAVKSAVFRKVNDWRFNPTGRIKWPQ